MTQTRSEPEPLGPDAEAQPAADPEAEPGPEPEAEAGAEPEPEAEAEAEAGAEPEPEPEGEAGTAAPQSEPEPVASRPPWGRLGTVMLAAAGVVLSAVVAAVVSAYLDIWSVREPPPGAPRISASSEVWWDLLSDHHLVRSAPGSAYDKDPMRFNDPEATLAHMVTEGGTNAGMMRVRLILTNFTRTPATITSVRARIERKHPAPDGPLFHCGGPQGGSQVTRVFLDLSTPERPAVERDPAGVPTGQYPSSVVQMAAQGDPAYFDIEIKADNVTGPAVTYEFVLDVTYTQGDGPQHLLVDQAGRPFALAQGIPTWSTGFRCDGRGWVAGTAGTTG
ncbi:hypothetical protein J7F03_11835 [Streptomyces sp. ISL-43]|uniref:hypothetical protein n=1 Tax=Streptomyces sp. ISL-43 TaxID=2819183 RepID=UPI001BE831CD|nr:hypothetical protein [Streptomyces sp. ISL-43]MBT2447752.1 hypothetical protein [Streptomyces sp. ISL-43]